MVLSARKRKSRGQEEEDALLLPSDFFPMDDLNDDVLEKILSWLPTSSFFRATSVCKRWKSTQTSKSFNLSCSQILHRDPWFFMINHSLDSSFAFDSTENSWRNLTLRNRQDFIPVASSGGLLCFRSSITGEFLLRNPLTGSSRHLPSQHSNDDKPLQAVAMTTVTPPSSYKLVTISGEIPNLCFKIYDSNSDSWSNDQELKNDDDSSSHNDDDDDSDIGTVYFLSKTGNVVVASNNILHRTPSKQYSSVITVKDGLETVYFLSSYGTIIACDLTTRCFTHLPKLLPPYLEYSIDLVECNGTMFVILLSEFYETASLRIWKLENNKDWIHVGMLPPAWSHELYGKKGDINCIGAGGGNKILVCFNSNIPQVYHRYFVFDLAAEEWSELPRCFKDGGESVDFVSALSFQPRIEATV